MEKSCSVWMRRLLALIKKDLTDEFRTRYAINSLLLFAVIALVMVSFATGMAGLSASLHAALLWIILFFSAMSGMGRSFAKEQEKNTAPALRLAAPPEIIFWGKLCFNTILMLALAVLVLLMYIFLLNPSIGNLPLLVLLVLLGSVCLAGASTILAAIVSMAANQGTLLPILSLPVLLPFFLVVINATQTAFQGAGFSQAAGSLLFLVSYAVVIITVSLLLFRHVWQD